MALPFLRKSAKRLGSKKMTKATMKKKQQCVVDPESSGTTELKDCDLIGPSTVEGMASCPCCNRHLQQGRQTVEESGLQKLYDCLFKDSGSETESSSIEDMDEEGSMMPGVLSGGVPYVVTENLVQGWMHKKGTGMDWMGSRAWKPRWAVLSLARIPAHEVDVPLLQIYWHPSSPTPSTVIQLDSAVVVPEDHEDKSKWNCFRFQIRHVKKSVDEHSVQITRSFSCPREGRDAWCQAISQALLAYEKRKAHARRQSSYLSLSPPRWRYFPMSWATGDAHPSVAKKFPPVNNSPPTSPRSPPRDLPRREPSLSLVGECLLAQIMD